MADATKDFDPDSYLAEAGGTTAVADFNPDEYLGGSTRNTAPTQDRSLANNEFPLPTPFGNIKVNPVATAHMVKNLGLEGGGATLGQIVGAPFEAVGGMHIGGAVGGALGNAIGQLTTPGKDFSFGEVGAAATAGAVPGASLAKAGGKELLKAGAKYAATNVAAENVKSLIDSKGTALAPIQNDLIAGAGGLVAAPISKFLDTGMRAETARAARSRGSVKRETLKLGQELGLVVPPSAVAPNIVNDSLQSLAGKAATAQETVIRNAPKIDAAIAKEIFGTNLVGLDAPFSPIALNTAKTGPNLVYAQIANTSPEAKGLLTAFKDAKDRARELFAAHRDAPNNATLAAAKSAEAEADVFDAGLKKIVPPDIYDRFDSARVQLAKIGLAERAVNKGTGGIDPAVIGQALDNGEKLTGNFARVGKFQNAFSRYVKDAAASPPSGVDYLKFFGKGALAGGGIATGHPGLAVAAPLALYGAERGARAGILSPFYQRNLAQPHYGVSNEDFQAALARYSAMNAGRQN